MTNILINQNVKIIYISLLHNHFLNKYQKPKNINFIQKPNHIPFYSILKDSKTLYYTT